MKFPTTQSAKGWELEPQPGSPQYSGAGLVAFISQNRDSIQLTQGKCGDKISSWSLQ